MLFTADLKEITKREESEEKAMKQVSLVLILILLLTLGTPVFGEGDTDYLSVSDAEQTENEMETLENNGSKEDSSQNQTEYIGAVPEEYFTSSDHPGRIEEITYESRDYTDAGETRIEKTAYVYLPYGYDEGDSETKYNIFYLMHGWTMTAGDFFNDSQSGIVNMLDHMIEKGDIPPMIVVCATFDAQNAPQGFTRSVDELSVFHRDLRDNLIPYIEGRYHTYAEGTSKEALLESRDHRAFGGFSLGAVTTWYQFIYNLDYIRYFLPMSGDCWIEGTYGGLYYPVETVDALKETVTDSGWEESDFRIYQGIGTSDPIWDQTDSQIQEMFTRDMFTPSNLHYAIIEGGRHDINACEQYIYHGLLDFFGETA